MTRHTYLQLTKLHDVTGRIDYATSPDRQEHLYATCNTTNDEFWDLLAKECIQEFTRSNKKGTCLQGREIFFSLPEYFLQFDLQKILEEFTLAFAEKYHVECVSGLHHNKSQSNLHIHLIFAERRLLPAPIDTFAKRAMHYNEDGRYVKTKKQVLDENGELRPGCTIIPKGALVRRNYFSVKDPIFQDYSFIPELKEMYTEMINGYSKDPSQHLQVFSKEGPYLGTIKIGYRNRKKKQISEINYDVQSWNNTVNVALSHGITYKNLCAVKRTMITSEVERSRKKYGKNPGLYSKIVTRATDFLQNIISIVCRFPLLQKLKSLLQEKGERIDHLQNVVFPDLEEQLMKAVGIFKGKERKEINLRKQQVTEQLKNEQKDFDEVLFANGYTSINDFWEKYYEYEEIYYQYTNDPVDDNIEQNKKSSLEEAISNAEAQKASGTKIRTKSNHLDHER